mgnify:CR=1 FL=1
MHTEKRITCISAIHGCRYLYFGKPSVRSIIGWIVASFLYIEFPRRDGYKKMFFLSRTASKRQDLSEMQELFLNSMDQPISVLNGRPRLNLRYFLDIKDWIYFCLSYTDDFCIQPSGLKSRVIIFLSGLHFYSSICRLTEAATDVYVFCDSVGLDAAIASRFNAKGATVTCIQHGQYRFEPGVMNSDLIPFLNACGSKILVWGLATEREYQRANIPNYEIEVAGKYSKFKPASFSDEPLSHLCVVLNGPDTSYVNSGLVHLAKKFSQRSGVSISIRKHPADKTTYEVPEFSSSDESVTLFLCHSSGFIVDSLLKKRRFAIYRDDFSPKIFGVIPCQIATIEDLQAIFSNSTKEFWQQLNAQASSEFIANV